MDSRACDGRASQPSRQSRVLHTVYTCGLNEKHSALPGAVLWQSCCKASPQCVRTHTRPVPGFASLACARNAASSASRQCGSVGGYGKPASATRPMRCSSAGTAVLAWTPTGSAQAFVTCRPARRAAASHARPASSAEEKQPIAMPSG
eukprot:scaffold6811_cov126-Isochrysis_galbana.AAC.2